MLKKEGNEILGTWARQEYNKLDLIMANKLSAMANGDSENPYDFYFKSELDSHFPKGLDLLIFWLGGLFQSEKDDDLLFENES